MKLGESAGLTDPGRKRRRNEDMFVCAPPVFAVADGMGGAQAGEIASRIAAAAFRDVRRAEALDAEQRLRRIIEEANRRIYARASGDPGLSGMGTTITAALVEGNQVALGHVGDSRAYRLRDGRLEQLTEDHSLVADLIRSGRLTPAEAETHPQRSVITRALGTDAHVEADVFTVNARPGDLFLLCSDGLNTMVDDGTILRMLEESRSLEETAQALVKAANRGGGEDNVTVVLFSVVEGGEDTLADAETAVNGSRGDDSLEDTLSGLEPVVPAAPVVQPAARPSRPAVPRPEARPRARPRLGRWLAFLVVGLILFVAALGVALWGVSRAHFVGASENGRLTVYQGVPWDLLAGVSLYREVYVSRVLAVQLSPQERRELFDHDLMSKSAARARIASYEREAAP